MIFDGLIFVGVSRFGYELGAASALEMMAHHHISAALAVPPHRDDCDFGRANEELADAARVSSGRLNLVARADPWDADLALEQFTVAVTQFGAVGLFLHPAEEHFRINDPIVKPLAEQAVELGVPIVVATGYPLFSEAIQITQFSRWCSDTPVILTNGGQFNISGLAQRDADLALQANNVYVHSTGVYRDDWLQHVVQTFGAERLLYASAAPQMNMGYELRRIELAHVSDILKPLVLGGNIKRLFDLDEAPQ